MRDTINKIKNKLPAGWLTIFAFLLTGITTIAQTPGGVPSVYLWTKADQSVSVTGTQVTQWINLGSATMTTQPSKTASANVVLNTGASGINFNPVVTFNGTSNQILPGRFATAPNDSNGQLIFAVAKQLSGSGVGSNIFANGPGGSQGIWNNGSGVQMVDGNGFTCSSTASIVNVPSIISVKYTTLNNGGAGRSSVNGLRSAANCSSIPVLVPSGYFQIGGRTYDTATNNFGGTFASRVFNGDIAEVIMFNGSNTVSNLQIKLIESYLAVKYGQTLTKSDNGDATLGEVISGTITEGDYVASDATTISWDYSVNSAYHNNIAGIGRDDNSTLNQKQSQSVSTGSQVTMALGSLTTTNQLNSGTITTDKQFWLWGDDVGSITAATTISGLGTLNKRLTRVWKTQNTNAFNQQITVYYPVSNFSVLGTTPYLIYATTAALLNTGATAIASTGTVSVNGVSNYAFTVPAARLANMNFFSFGGTNVPISLARTHVLVNPSTINSSQQNGRLK